MSEYQKPFLKNLRDKLGFSRITDTTSNKLLTFLENSPDDIFTLAKRDIGNLLYLGGKYALFLKNELGRLKATRIKVLAKHNLTLHIEAPKFNGITFEERKCKAIKNNQLLLKSYKEICKLDIAIEQISETIWGLESFLRRLEFAVKSWEK